MLNGILFVEKCRLCRRPVQEYGRQDPHCLCKACWLTLQEKTLPQIKQEPLLLFTGSNEARQIPVLAPLSYDEDCQKLLWSLKYSGDKLIARVFGLFLASLYQEQRNLATAGEQMRRDRALFDVNWLIVPVPLHWTRLWKRGYNQAEAIARELSNHIDLKIMTGSLHRTRRTPALANLDRCRRAQVMENVFTASKKHLHGRQIILIDDVITTGATATACAQAIYAAGALDCRIFAAARTPLK